MQVGSCKWDWELIAISIYKTFPIVQFPSTFFKHVMLGSRPVLLTNLLMTHESSGNTTCWCRSPTQSTQSTQSTHPCHSPTHAAHAAHPCHSGLTPLTPHHSPTYAAHAAHPRHSRHSAEFNSDFILPTHYLRLPTLLRTSFFSPSCTLACPFAQVLFPLTLFHLMYSCVFDLSLS